MHTHTHTHTHIYIYIYIYIYIHTDLCIWVFRCIYYYKCISIYLYIYRTFQNKTLKTFQLTTLKQNVTIYWNRKNSTVNSKLHYFWWQPKVWSKHLSRSYGTIHRLDPDSRKITRSLEKIKWKMINSVPSSLTKLAWNIYIYIYIYIYMLTNPSAQAGYDTWQFFKWSSID